MASNTRHSTQESGTSILDAAEESNLQARESTETLRAAATVDATSTKESASTSRISREGKNERADLDEDDDDADDLVAISGEETMLQEGAYRQVGGTEVRKIDRSKLIRKLSINLLLIASWFFFSTMMNLYNSWLFSKKRMNFAYPLFTTAMHMVVQFILSSALLFACRNNSKFTPRRRNGKRAKPSVQDYFSKVMPCALATALDIGLSNLSLQTITLTFYTMCKSSNLAFVLLFAFIFGLEKLRLSLIGIITLITVGVIMMVAAETEFVLSGAVEVLTASAMGGLRWALMQILLKRKAMGMSNPVATMFWLSPLMGFFMLVTSLLIEDLRAMAQSPFFANAGSGFHTVLLLIFPGLIVFCMNLCEFTLIMRTSVMTLSVAGIFKEIMTIMISSSVFGDELTPINVTGLCVAILGIALYNYYKYRLMLKRVAEGGQVSGGHGHGAEDDEDEEGEDEDGNDEGESGRGRFGRLGGGGDGSGSSELNGTKMQMRQQDTLSKSAAPAWAAQNGESVSASEARPDGEDAALLSSEERAQRRMRDEEADLQGWQSSGFQRTGNGYDSDSTE